jgi:phosphate transport system substrate-binding protein
MSKTLFLFNIKITAAAVLSVMLVSCSYKTSPVTTISIKGSDTMLYLTKNLAEEYMRKNPGVSIYVEGGGTAGGIKSLLKGETDIAAASRTLRAEEVKEFANLYKSIGISYTIAKDALSIYINSSNPVKDFTPAQLKNIFTCRITRWKELGGTDGQIEVIVRPPNSGTYLYFKEHILGTDDYCSGASVITTTEDIIKEVKRNKNAIGYGGIGYGEKLLHAKVNGIEPSEENVRNDTYPVSRYLHFITLNTPSGKAKDFINWVMTPEGQKIVKQAGYIPLYEITY